MQPDLPRLGILMLDSRFPRPPGDVGNPATWPFPVRFGVVPGATPRAVVCGDTERFVQAFIDVGAGLVAQGCTGIATTCGFLAPLRARLATALGVPVAASALEQSGQIAAGLPAGQRLGVLTISAENLTPGLRAVAGVPEDAAVRGMEGSRFAATILGDLPDLDQPMVRQELAQAAHKLCTEAPRVGAILLECTNMAPYADDISRATGRPVHSIFGYLNWFHEGLVPARFPASAPRGC